MTAHATSAVEDIAFDLLMEAIYRAYHYDFRGYSRASMRRRVESATTALRIPSVTQLLDRVLHDPETFAAVLPHLTVQVSDMFRDPAFFRVLRERVIPHLSTYPFIRIWVAGCATGEEAYSLAIMLHEQGVLERALIYATDINATSLHTAKLGIYDLDRVRGFSENYFQAGGEASLSDYYVAAYGRASFGQTLRRHIVFSDHCLATDAVFAEVHLVTCRNVLIYFGHELQRRVLGLFHDALCPRGFLGLGSGESTAVGDGTRIFESFASSERIYRRR